MCRSCVVEEYCKKPSNICTNRNSFPYTKTHEDTMLLPIKNKINNEKQNKKNSKTANNVHTDNRRMTGNVNIYICSGANDNGQEKNKKNSRPQSYTETSSDTTTEQSNPRCVGANSTSLCKLINSIQRKRRKLKAQQLSNIVNEKTDKNSSSSDNNIACDNKILRKICRKESSESNNGQMDVKICDEDIECKDTISSSRDDCCCKVSSFSNTVLRQDSLDSAVPCSSVSVCDNSKRPQSWTTIYSSETRARLDDSDVCLNAIYTNVKRMNYRKNNDENEICGNDSEYIVCDAIDGSKWLPKSIYTDCVMYGEYPKECFAESCNYRNKRFQDLILDRKNIRMGQMGYKLLQQSPRNCERERMARQWSVCSCIAEEEEDYCTNVDRVEKKSLKNLCNDVKYPERIFVCGTPSSKLADTVAICESFSAAREHFEETQVCKSTFGDLEICSKGTTVCVTSFGDSEESPKVTRVSKEIVAEELSKDITVCRAIFGEQKGPPEEETVCKTALSDSKEAPKETICEKIPNSNFAYQEDVKWVSLNDAKDKLVKENTNSPNLNDPKENPGNAKIVRLDNKHDDIVPNNFIGRKSAGNVRQDEQTKGTISSSDQSKYPTASLIRSIKYSKPLSKNIYSRILPRVELYDRPNPVSNPNIKKISKILGDQRRTRMQLSSKRSIKRYSQQPDKISKDPKVQDLVSNKNNRAEKETQKKSKKEEENEDIPKETGMTEEKPRYSFLHRSVKKLIDVIKYGRALLKDQIEAGIIIADDRKNYRKPKVVSETEDKTIDEKDQQEISKKVVTPMRSPRINKEITMNTVYAARLKRTAPVADSRFLEKDKKIDVSIKDQTTLLKPKLLRIIAMKKLHPPPTVITVVSKPQVPEVESVPVKISINECIDQEEISAEKIISQKLIPADVMEKIKTEESVAPKISIAEIKDTPENIIDTSKDIADIPTKIIVEDRISKDILHETTELYVSCPQKKPKEETQKFISCKYGVPSDSNGCLCLIAKCIKCSSTFEDCPCKDNEFEQEKDYCARCRLSKVKCTCISTQYLKSCLKITDTPKFRSISPSKISLHICTGCCRIREECKCKKMACCCQPRDNCRYAMGGNCSRMADKYRCRSPTSRITCCKPKEQCFTLSKCHKIKKAYNYKKAMICLYCDNPQDKCICRAPIGKCSICRLPSDNCNCQDDCYEQIDKRLDESRTMQVTSWKPRREIRQYFSRNLEDFRSDSIEGCRCYEKLKRQCPKELPYQRLNIFSDVMNELQQKMSESICCTQCWRNPCCCGPRINQDKEKEEKEAKGYIRCPEVKKPPKSKFSKNKSPNNCQCNLNLRNERNNTVKKLIPIRRIACICKLSPCRCKKNRLNHKRPLAKCYYCKSLPCTCITTR